MKFIHLNDIFIGNTGAGGNAWEEKRSGEIEESLRNVLRKAEDEDVGLILITGGLFSHIPVERELNEVSDIFRAHPDIRIVITAGETDIIVPSSPVLSFTWPGNVYYILSGSVTRVIPDKTGVEVYASSCVRKDVSGEASDKAAAADFAAAADKYEDSEPVRIAMLRAEDSDIVRAFSSSCFSYVACGGGSKTREIIESLAYAPGHLEPFDMSDTGVHGVMMGELSIDTGKLTSINFVPMASAMYVTLNIRMNSSVTADELAASISSEMDKRGRKNIYSLHLTGMRNPDERIDLENIKREFRISSIKDETEPEYNYEKLFREHSQDIIGFYISSIVESGRKMSDLEKKAMLYGIDALISTSAEET